MWLKVLGFWGRLEVAEIVASRVEREKREDGFGVLVVNF